MTPTKVTLVFAPADSQKLAGVGVRVVASVESTDARVSSELAESWWSDPAIVQSAARSEIDRLWDWNSTSTEYGAEQVELDRLAIVTGDGSVQGVMGITSKPVQSPVSPEHSTLLVERLFSAPRNRPDLRKVSDQPIYFGVGIQLLQIAVGLSRDRGCSGRLRLDASPGGLTWYRRRGFLPTAEPPVDYDSVQYLPMELSADAAERLLARYG